MRIYVGGSLERVTRDSEFCGPFVRALGAEIVRRGHVLLNGCRSSLDSEVVGAAADWLAQHGGNAKEQVVGYCLKGEKPSHAVGTVRYSALRDWQMNHARLDLPEQIGQADATIFVAGGEGTFWARNWASLARRPVLGVPRFGGAAEEIFDQELERLRHTAPALAEAYEALNAVSDDMAAFASDVVSVAARMVVPRTVFTIMSFEPEYRDVFASYHDVCREFDFDAVRTDEDQSLERIVPRIEAGIRGSAFVIADVSEAGPNVFYELGYAKGLGKDVVLTARQGTPLPFDIGDVPTIFWAYQEELKAGLRKCIAGVASKYGR